MTTIKRFQDYEEDDPDIEFRKNSWEFWNALKKCREEYHNEVKEFDGNGFTLWLKERYGINLQFFGSHITDKYEIVDEQKHLMFLLKYK